MCSSLRMVEASVKSGMNLWGMGSIINVLRLTERDRSLPKSRDKIKRQQYSPPWGHVSWCSHRTIKLTKRLTAPGSCELAQPQPHPLQGRRRLLAVLLLLLLRAVGAAAPLWPQSRPAAHWQ